MHVYWCYLKQQREQVELVPDQAEIRFLNSFSDAVCLRLRGLSRQDVLYLIK